MKQLIVLGSVAALAVTSLHIAPPQAAKTPDTWKRVAGEPARTPKAAAPLRWRDAQLPAHATARLAFAPLADTRVKALHRRNASAQHEPMQIGLSRDTASDSLQKALPRLQWAATPDGGAAARIVVSTTDAKGLRVALKLLAIDPRVELRFAGSNAPSTIVGKVTGREAFDLANDRVFMTPSTEGRSQIIEIYAPKGVPVQRVQLQVPRVSHLLTTANAGFKIEKGIGTSGACNVDTTCRVNELGQHFVNAKNAVAHMVYDKVVNGTLGTYICTGTLLADTVSATQAPYFYTANHCIDDQTEASTLETYWRFESTSCGSNVAAARVQLLGGSTFLYSNASSDAALLRLNAAPPAGSYFAAWDSSPLPANAPVTAIHHPDGDLKKVSLGQHTDKNDFTVEAAWLSGTTEPGSSGSGLFTNDANGYYLRGGLWRGSAGCANSGSVSNPDNRDEYSSFAVVFPHIQQYLAPPLPATPTLRDFSFDGKADVFWRNTSTGGNDVWRSAYSAQRQITSTVASQDWQVAGVGDFNGDSKADVLWRNSASGANDIWLSAISSTRQTIQPEASVAWKVAGVGDFNGDGRADIFWRNTTTGGTAYWPSANRSLSQVQATVSNQQWQVAAVGDFNDDGKDDVLWRNSVTGANDLWRSGTAAQRQGLTTVANVDWKIVGAGDFNKDGRSDILWRNSATGANVIWRSANASTQQAVSTVADQNWKVALVADFDGDGYADVFWRNAATGYNDMWKGAQSAQRLPLTRVADLNWKVIP